MTSRHWEQDREAREQIINEIGIGEVVKTVVVDKGHRNGPEVHEITSTAIIVIYNQRTHKMITKLIARPNQIRRYYREDEIVPNGLIQLARDHQRRGYNR